MSIKSCLLLLFFYLLIQVKRLINKFLNYSWILINWDMTYYQEYSWLSHLLK